MFTLIDIAISILLYIITIFENKKMEKNDFYYYIIFSLWILFLKDFLNEQILLLHLKKKFECDNRDSNPGQMLGKHPS